MDTETALQVVQDLLKEVATEIRQPETGRLDFVIPAEKLPQAVEIIMNNKWGYLSVLTGLDHPAPQPTEEQSQPVAEGKVEALYHFANKAAIATLRVSVPYSQPEVPSIHSLIPSVSIYERELMEMFGVTVVGTPDPRRLLLPDEWPEGVYPLRKSFQVVGSASPDPSV